MNTTLTMTEMPGSLTQRTHPISPVNLVAFPGRAPADWLPVPSCPQPRTTPIYLSGQAAKSSRTLWQQPTDQFSLELLGMGLLAVVSALGIIYGFSCLVDLVQHWALFTLGVGNLIQ